MDLFILRPIYKNLIVEKGLHITLRNVHPFGHLTADPQVLLCNAQEARFVPSVALCVASISACERRAGCQTSPRFVRLNLAAQKRERTNLLRDQRIEGVMSSVQVQVSIIIPDYMSIVTASKSPVSLSK